MSADDAWGGDLPGASVRDLVGIAAAPDHDALANQGGILNALDNAVESLRSGLEGALSAIGSHGGERDLEALAMVARVQAARRTLAEVETITTRWLGLTATIPKTGTLPDGSTYEVKRGQNRKSWDHDSWKHDVRAKVLARAGVAGHDLVDPETGDLVDVQGLLTWVQEVSGSAAPRLTNLRGLGLDPDDYCETFPGLWAVQVVPPAEPEDRTTCPPHLFP